MKKIEAVLRSCRNQDKSSVKHNSFFFFFLRLRIHKIGYWQMFCNHCKISIIVPYPSLKSHVHLILCSHPSTHTPASNHSESFPLRHYDKMGWLNLKDKNLWFYILATLGKVRIGTVRIMSSPPLCWKPLWHSEGNVNFFISPSILKLSKGIAPEKSYWEKHQHTKDHSMMPRIKSYLRNWKSQRERVKETKRDREREPFINGDDLRIPQENN